MDELLNKLWQLVGEGIFGDHAAALCMQGCRALPVGVRRIGQDRNRSLVGIFPQLTQEGGDLHAADREVEDDQGGTCPRELVKKFSYTSRNMHGIAHMGDGIADFQQKKKIVHQRQNGLHAQSIPARPGLNAREENAKRKSLPPL